MATAKKAAAAPQEKTTDETTLDAPAAGLDNAAFDVADEGKALTAQDTSASTALAVSDYEDDANAGFENLDASFFKIPFIGILQKSSPEVDDDSADRIEGAKVGMFLVSDNKELIDGKEKGFALILLHVERKYVEWVPRTQGGGLVASYSPEDDVVKQLTAGKSEFDKITTDDGNELKQTFYAYCLQLLDNGDTRGVVLAFTSSATGPFKDWMGLVRGQKFVNRAGDNVNYPLWAHVYRATTKFFENKKGTWYNWVFKFEGGTAEGARLNPTSDLYQRARAFRNLITSGKARADMDGLAKQQSGEATDKDAF